MSHGRGPSADCEGVLIHIETANTRYRPRAHAIACALLVLLFAPPANVREVMAGENKAGEIVVVRTSDAEPYTQAEAALREKLEAARYSVRSVLVKEVAQKGIATALGTPSAVIAVGSPSAKWLHEQLPAGIAMSYCMVGNPSDAGLLAGRPVAGVTTEVSLPEQFGLIAAALPDARAVGMLFRSDTADGRASLKAATDALPRGWRVETVAVNEHASIAEAIDAMMQKNVDVIWTTADQKLYDTAAVRALLLAAVRANRPVWGFSPAFVRAGALLGVGVEPRAQGTQVADLVLRSLADTTTAPKPESPREYQIAVNLILAQQLGITIPEPFVRRATFVFRPEK